MVETEGLFHCDHCGDAYDLDKIKIHGYPKDDPKIIVCHGCYTQLKGGIPNGNVI